jgi:hypothetical protein
VPRWHRGRRALHARWRQPAIRARFRARPTLAGFSVDVVDITELVGNHHRHPTGEIDLIMPVDPDAKFDGRGAGWLVYPPGSGHRPTVSAGRALILYLLPAGRIEWSQSG